MKHRITFLLLAVIGIMLQYACSQKTMEPVDYVNMFTGTSNSRWMLGPYAGVPYGMVQLGPNNQQGGWMSGYEYSIMNVTGFGHIHAWTMSGLMIMPFAQDFTTSPGAACKPYRGAHAGFHSRIFKETEVASPGYYACDLYDAYCKAELTATARCGFHRYTFQEKDMVRIMLVLDFPTEYSVSITDAVISKSDEKTVEGYAYKSAAYGTYKLFFSIQFNKPFTSFNGWNSDGVFDHVNEIAGSGNVGAFVTYSTSENEEILMKVGLSLVDIEGARKNLQAELEPFGWDFDAVAASARDQWNDLLSTIKVKGSREDMEKFYTNFYRSFAKQTWNDADGRYVDPLKNIQQLPEGVSVYGGDAFWNTHWNWNTVVSLVAPDKMSNWVKTQLELYDKVGWTNNGPTGLRMTGIMDATHEIAFMVSAYQKGIRDYDVNKLYEAVRHNGTVQGVRIPGNGPSGMTRLNIYNKLGYVPYDSPNYHSSLTFDYAYTDFCAAQLAKALDKTVDYNMFIKRSESWKNLLHPEIKMMVPKDSLGNWKPDYDPFSGHHWIEGNGWQYSWYVPHDIPQLVSLVGKEQFNERLKEGFEKSEKHDFTAHAFDRHQDVAHEYYINHGNQVNMQASFLFNYSGSPWLTQKYTRAILESYYGNTPYHGWGGDEDEGQMGGWFVIASMGLFEMNGAVTDDPVFDISSPLFDEIIIYPDKHYNPEEPFKITAKNNSDKNIYIQSATLNGKSLNHPKLRFRDLVKGGELVFEMGPEPNKSWGVY